MVTPVITAIDEAYFPGLDALYNSFKANADPDLEFFCIVDGDADLVDRVAQLGVNVITPPHWADRYPVSPWWPTELPALYARLQIPELFPDCERAIWIDADCIIIDPLTRLAGLDFTEPVAACRPSHERYKLGDMLINCPHDLMEVAGQFSGLLVFNIPAWNKLDITGKCAKAMMNTRIVYKWGDQSVLAYVLRGVYHELSMDWQTFAHRTDATLRDARILHWLGSVPWKTEVRNKDWWQKYATKKK